MSPTPAARRVLPPCAVQTPVLVRTASTPSALPWYAGVANDVNNPDSRGLVAKVTSSTLERGTPTSENGVRIRPAPRKRPSIATGINDEGLVVGYSQLVEGSNLVRPPTTG
jgi:hypothetical protein